MAELSILNLYTDSYLADTSDLHAQEHGAYLLILIYLWRHRASMPLDHELLRKVAKVNNAQWPRVWSTISRFFSDLETKEPINSATSKITQKKLLKEYENAISRVKTNRANGARGGMANSLKRKGSRPAIAQKSPLDRSSETQARLHHTDNRSPVTVTDRSGDRSIDEKVRALVEAAGGNVAHESTGIEIIKSILDLEASGCDFDLDILPVIRERVPGLDSPLRTWSARWLRDAIIEHKSKRLNSRGKNGHAGEPAELFDTPEAQDRLCLAFKSIGHWRPDWGPAPGEPGCVVAAEILKKHELIE